MRSALLWMARNERLGETIPNAALRQARRASLHARRAGRGRLRRSRAPARRAHRGALHASRREHRLARRGRGGRSRTTATSSSQDAERSACGRAHRALHQAHPAGPRPGLRRLPGASATTSPGRCAAGRHLVLDRHGGLGLHRPHARPGRGPHGRARQRRHRPAGLPPAHRRPTSRACCRTSRPSAWSRAPTTSPPRSPTGMPPRSTPTSSGSP